MRLFAFHGETFCLAVSFSGQERRSQRGPILARIVLVPMLHTLHKPMRRGWTTRVEWLPLPSRRPASAEVVAPATFTHKNVRPPDCWAGDRRVVDARERSHWLVGVKWKLESSVDRKVKVSRMSDEMRQNFRCWTRHERFEIDRRPIHDVVNNLQELRRRSRSPQSDGLRASPATARSITHSMSSMIGRRR